MQDRYAGDIGDYGKLGLLRALQRAGLTIGVNWYLVPDEKHNGDGRYVQYLKNDELRPCDEALWLELKCIVDSKERTVSALENENILKAGFYSAPLVFPGKTKPERVRCRKEWHRHALERLSGLDLVFADPDNGILVPSACGTPRENKYAKPEELADYYRQGSSVVYYQHKARRSDDFYLKQHRRLIEYIGDETAVGFGLKFIRTSQRYYFFIFHPHHSAAVSKTVDWMIASPWKSCFERLPREAGL